MLQGIALAVGASALWGLSGNVAQALFQHYGFSTNWLVNTRLLGAGILCLLYSSFGPDRVKVLGIWKDTGDRFRLVIYAIFGMMGVQYTFFSAIKAGNAASATLLQYTSPVFIIAYNALCAKRWPTPREVLGMSLAIPGICLLVTNASMRSLSIPVSALVWGLVSAVAAAFYIAYPPELIKRWGSSIVVGWSMFLGGVMLLPFGQLWETGSMQWCMSSIGATIFVVFLGTFVTFVLYLESLKYISPTTASILGSAEPLTATLVSVLWLKVPLGWAQVLGGLMIVGTVVALSTGSTQNKSERAAKANVASLFSKLLHK